MSLLCNDYKILSKALAIILVEVLESIIYPDQSFCVPGRRFDNVSFIRDILDCGKLFDLDFGLILIDQMAFGRIEYMYLWSVLNAFGFNSDFISYIDNILKINGDLCSQFRVYGVSDRDVRCQACYLSHRTPVK